MIAVDFFMEWGGLSYNQATETAEEGRARGARDLAEAEAWAKAEGVTAEWVPDDLPWEGDYEPPDEVFGCILKLGDESVSLWSIGDPSPEYRRVVEAELADELREGFFAALANHIRQL